MRIQINRPHPDYPLAYVHVPMNANLDNPELGDILAKNRITLIGRWEPDLKNDVTVGFKAPVLLEDEHTKPRKTTRSRKK